MVDANTVLMLSTTSTNLVIGSRGQEWSENRQIGDFLLELII